LKNPRLLESTTLKVLLETFGQKSNFCIKTKSKGINYEYKTSFMITKA
jgi:hypothetical protein